MGMRGQIGCVQNGFLADLIVVDGDPMQDVSILHKEKHLLAVMKAGKFYKTTNS